MYFVLPSFFLHSSSSHRFKIRLFGSLISISISLSLSLFLLTRSISFESLLFHRTRVLRLQFPLLSFWTTLDQIRIFLSYLQLSSTPGEIKLAHGLFPQAWTFVDDFSLRLEFLWHRTASFRVLCGS